MMRRTIMLTVFICCCCCFPAALQASDSAASGGQTGPAGPSGATGVTGVTGAVGPTGSSGLPSGTLQGTPPFSSIAQLANNVNFTGTFSDAVFDGRVTTVNASWTTVGTTGGGSDTAVIEVYDFTASSILCFCSFGAGSCIAAAGTPETCNCGSGGMTPGDKYTLRWNSATALHLKGILHRKSPGCTESLSLGRYVSIAIGRLT